MAIQWQNNVQYEPEAQRVTFLHKDAAINQAELMMDYLEELYPDKPWIEIAQLAIPELASVQDFESLRFYSI